MGRVSYPTLRRLVDPSWEEQGHGVLKDYLNNLLTF
jgi:hypothetical protein